MISPIIIDWLNLSIRWIHMITGVAWIGASFYFVWLENHLNRLNARTGLSGDLWAIHGGGIYHLEKYKLAPPELPEQLHWFKWEAYFTWITGIALLSVVYYFNASLFLLAPDSNLAPSIGILISVAAIISGWIVYHLLCNSKLGQKPFLLGVVIFLLFVAASYGLSQVFSGRAAYIHVGAMIGTIMVGNVFFIIMPGQRNLVQAIIDNKEPDPILPAKALLRSRHNNYFTLPVLFIMISNHFPSTYGSDYNWLILAVLALVSIFIRHYFNTRHKNQNFAWAIPVGAIAIITLALLTSSNLFQSTAQKSSALGSVDGSISSLSTDEIMPIIKERCTSCHSAKPTSLLFKVPPLGVILDNKAQVEKNAERILSQVKTQVMPLGNMTKMTDEERNLVVQWAQEQTSDNH